MTIIIIFLLRECSNQQNTNALIKEITNYSDTAKYYKSSSGNLIAYNKLLKVQNEQQLRTLISTNEQIRNEISSFKKIGSVTNIIQGTLIRDTIKMESNAIPCDFKPFELKKSTEHYLFKGILSPNDFIIDSIYVPNTINIIIGKRKVGFLKYEEQINVMNSNPYITTTNLSNISIQRKKKWWERGVIKFGAGVIIGYGASAKFGKN